jgi:hypothetical protein
MILQSRAPDLYENGEGSTTVVIGKITSQTRAYNLTATQQLTSTLTSHD